MKPQNGAKQPEKASSIKVGKGTFLTSSYKMSLSDRFISVLSLEVTCNEQVRIKKRSRFKPLKYIAETNLGSV